MANTQERVESWWTVPEVVPFAVLTASTLDEHRVADSLELDLTPADLVFLHQLSLKLEYFARRSDPPGTRGRTSTTNADLPDQVLLPRALRVSGTLGDSYTRDILRFRARAPPLAEIHLDAVQKTMGRASRAPAHKSASVTATLCADYQGLK